MGETICRVVRGRGFLISVKICVVENTPSSRITSKLISRAQHILSGLWVVLRMEWVCLVHSYLSIMPLSIFTFPPLPSFLSAFLHYCLPNRIRDIFAFLLSPFSHPTYIGIWAMESRQKDLWQLNIHSSNSTKSIVIYRNMEFLQNVSH